MSLKPYPHYKDSRVEWLDNVPKHWIVQPATAICRIMTSTVDKKSYDDEFPVRLCNYTDVYYNDILIDDPEYMKATATQSQIVSFTPKAGDVAITKDSETSDDIGIPAYVRDDMPGVVFGYHLAIFRASDVRYGRFIRYLFESKYVKTTFENKTPGVTRVGLSQNTMKYLRVPTPPVHEAEQISDYLDRETAEIDAFIADQEELIVLLNERRAATITQAVTKGLDPTVPIKDSGLEWLGEIPEDWTIDKVSRVFVASKGRSAAKLTKEYCGENVGKFAVYSGQTENDGIMGYIDEYEFDAADVGMLLMTTVGAKAMTARIIYGKFSLSQNCMVVHPTVDVVLRFYLYLFQVLLAYEKGHIPQHMQPSFRMEDLYQFRFPRLPVSEQQVIVDRLDTETREIDVTIMDAKEAIALSKERRGALISAAVTGKIDVRDAIASKQQSLEGELVVH